MKDRKISIKVKEDWEYLISHFTPEYIENSMCIEE